MLDGERLSGCKKLMNDFVMFGFEPTALGRRETLFWKRKIVDEIQRLSNLAEFFFDMNTKRRDGRCCALLWTDRVEGI